MAWLFFLLVLLAGAIYAAWINFRAARNLRRFWDRPNTMSLWTQEFPMASGEVRLFLQLFNDAFVFSRKRVFCFAPGDRIADIHRALYPDPGLAAGGERERFDRLLRHQFGVTLDAPTKPEATLGELFRHLLAIQTRRREEGQGKDCPALDA